MSRKRVLIVTELYSIGGLETQVAGMVRVLTARGHEVHFASGAAVAPAHLPPGLATAHYPLPLGSSSTAADLLAAVAQLEAIVRTRHIDLVHGHPFGSFLPAYLAARRCGVPFVMTLHGPASLRPAYGYLHDLLLKFHLLPNADRVYCVSPEVRALAASYVPAETCRVLVNAVDLTCFAPIETRPGPPRWALVIRVDAEKLPGLKDFCAKVAQLALGPVDVYGDGPCLEELRCFIRDGGWADLIRLRGPHNAIHHALTEGYTGVAGMGRVVLEAGAMNLPAVLVGYDGLKGLLDEATAARAAWWNFSGRGLETVSAARLAQQVQVELPEGFSRFHLRRWIEKHHDEEQIWREYEADIQGLQPRASPLDAALEALFQVHLGVSTPYLWNRELGEAVMALLATRWPEGRLLLHRDALADAERRQAFAELRLALAETRQELRELVSRQTFLLDELRAQRERDAQSYREALAREVADKEAVRAALAEQEQLVNGLTAQATHAREVVSLATAQLADVRLSRRYKLGNILSAIKRRPFGALGVCVRWAVGGYKRRGVGLAGALRAPDPLLAVQSGLQRVPAVPRGRSSDGVLSRAARSKGAIIFVSSVDWQIYLAQRNHHFARHFARAGYVTVYDCSDFVNYDFTGFKEIEPNLFLFRGAVESLRQIPSPILWTFCYNFNRRQDFLPGTRVVYDLIDDFAVHPFDPAFLRRNHAQALREATLVTYVARHLERFCEGRRDALYLPNGVDDAHFADQSIRLPDADPLCELLAQRKPIAGYYGALAEWFDYALLEETAALRPEWNFVLIGPEYDHSLKSQPVLKRPNVRWLGPRDYSVLPAYLRAFDVAMIPFVINDITRATSPLKLYEFFAGEKPVVTTPMPECMAFPEVRIVRDAEEFAAALEAAREQAQCPAFRARLRELARENSWQARVTELDRLLAEHRTPVARS